MEIVRFQDRHYRSLVKVWRHYKWVPCPLELLPKLGYVIEDEGKFVAALFAYLSISDAIFVDWAVAALDITQAESDKAFKVLVDKFLEDGKNFDCKFVYSMTKNPRFIDILRDNGFGIAEQGMTSLVRPLVHGDMAFIKD